MADLRFLGKATEDRLWITQRSLEQHHLEGIFDALERCHNVHQFIAVRDELEKEIARRVREVLAEIDL